MSKTVVEIVQDGSYRAAQPPQVFVAEGNEVDFVNAGSVDTLLVFTPETESIFSPKPTSPVTIAGGATVTYTLLAPMGTGYLAQVLPQGTTPWPIAGAGADGPVLTILPSGNRGPSIRTGN